MRNPMLGTMGARWCSRGFTRGGCVLLLALTAVFTLLIPATLYADRDPTSAERAGIQKSAHRAYGEPGERVEVSDIRVSTIKRAWAAANVLFYFDSGSSGGGFQSKFHRQSGGSWKKTDQKMPAAIEEDLGLVQSDDGGSNAVRIGIYVVLGILVLFALGKLGGGSLPSGGSSEPTPPRRGPPVIPAGGQNPPAHQTCPCRRCGGARTEPNPHPPPDQIICRGCYGRGWVDC
jgi:hypothetical protein